jgi:hypothetical protein
VFPYLRNAWPKNADFKEFTMPDGFTLCVAIGEAFPQAFKELKDLIRFQKSSYCIFDLMSEKKLCTHFAEDSLSFLNSVIDAETCWLPKNFVLSKKYQKSTQ